jgi:CHAT domain-containing protein
LQSLNPDDGKYFATLNALAGQLIARFKRSGNPNDLDEGVERTKELVALTSPDPSSRLPALGNLGTVFQTRFRIRGDAEDLAQAIHHFEACVESCPLQHPLYVPFVANLAMGLRARYLRDGDVSGLDRIVEICSTALSECPSENHYRDSLLNNFANALTDRFEKRGNRADLDMALTHYQACLELRPPGHPTRHSVLGNLGDVLLSKFRLDGDVRDLESAADYCGAALQLRAPGQEGYVFHLIGLGTVLLTLFETQGDVQRMEMAIRCYQAALASSTVANLDYIRLLSSYGGALRTRYAIFGDINDLNQAVEYLTASHDIQSPSFPDRANTLYSLGGTLLTRFNAMGNIADLDLSVEHCASALQLCAPSPHERPKMLSLYGNALLARFKAKGDAEDLNLAVSVCKDALASLSQKHTSYSSDVANLASVLLEHFNQTGNIDDVQVIIDHCDSALASAPPPQTAFALQATRAKAFFERFQYGGDKPDIDTAVEPLRELVKAIPQGHVEYIPAHIGFATALQIRFQLTTHRKDIDEAIEHYRIARRDCRLGDTNYVTTGMDLGNALRLRFVYSDDIDALDESIVLLSEVEEVLSTASGNTQYNASLINLGIALFMRFQMQRNIADLNTAIERITRALARSTWYEEFSTHSTLATLLSVRYDEHSNLEDLEQSVKYFRSAADKMPANHLHRSVLCRNYGHALVKLAGHRDSVHHLDVAIALYEEAITRSPSDHYDQPLTIMKLAEAVHQRGRILLCSNDIHTAMNLLTALIQTVPEGQLLQMVYLQSASTAKAMYELSKLTAVEESFMEEAFRYYEKGARYSPGHGFELVSAALQWAEFADKVHHSSALRAYQTSLDFLDKHVVSTASVKHRHETLLEHHLARHTSSLADNATACAISEGRLELAVELSEQGRGLLWSQMARIRTPLDSLRSADEDGRTLASEFERISSQLMRSSVPVSNGVLSVSRLSLEEDARQYRQLSKELDAIVERIRAKEGFQSFWRPMPFHNLQEAASGGPVILINVSQRRCDALIILHNEPPRLVPLPRATIEGITAMSRSFYETLKTTSSAGQEKVRDTQVASILRRLWDMVVSPVVDELLKFLPRGSRIWWCPTSKLTSLPLHGAGPYRRGSNNLANIFISSYTPTLSALIRSRSHKTSAHPGTPLPFIAIGQSKPATSTGERELEAVGAELDLVQSLVPTSMTFDRISDDDATADGATEALRTHAWAHLACHGRQDPSQPFDSAFAMRDRPLTLVDIVRADLSQPDFAFLSACHTAVGDKNTPDEVIHLAAGMQFAGFRSVIGTMWPVDDTMAHAMVGAFYQNMFKGDDVPDCTNAAKALHVAAKTVDKGVVSMEQRIVFIHIGA